MREWRQLEAEAIETWGTGERLSDHLRLEVAAAVHRGRPLDAGAPVPGCGCPSCTGIAEDHPVRNRRPRRTRRDLRPAIDVDAARAVPLLEVARRLGIEVNRHGRALCPFHDDSKPSLHLNMKKGRAFCNPCGRSWDAIGLYMEFKRASFLEACRELAA